MQLRKLGRRFAVSPRLVRLCCRHPAAPAEPCASPGVPSHPPGAGPGPGHCHRQAPALQGHSCAAHSKAGAGVAQRRARHGSHAAPASPTAIPTSPHCRGPSRREKGKSPTSDPPSPPDPAQAEGRSRGHSRAREKQGPFSGQLYFSPGTARGRRLSWLYPKFTGLSPPLLLALVAIWLRDVKILLINRCYTNILGLNPTSGSALAFQQRAIPVTAPHASLCRSRATVPQLRAMVAAMAQGSQGTQSCHPAPWWQNPPRDALQNKGLLLSATANQNLKHLPGVATHFKCN